MKAFIGVNNKEIALSELVVVPRFFRFDNVLLVSLTGSQSIAQKYESFRGHLLSIKASLYDSNVTRFYFAFNQEDTSQFNDHSELLEHIRQIVSICDSSRGYSFVLRRFSDAFGDVISSILGMPTIARSSFVSIPPHWFLSYYDALALAQLPIETISNWLNRERNALDQNQRERLLVLVFPAQVHDTQIQEMCDFLKQVSF